MQQFPRPKELNTARLQTAPKMRAAQCLPPTALGVGIGLVVLGLLSIINRPRSNIKLDDASSALSTKEPGSAKTSQQELDMRAVYQRMTDDFLAKGLDLQAIHNLQSWFYRVEGDEDGITGELPWPKTYDKLPEPLPANSVRLLVIPLEDAPRIASLAAKFAADVAEILPEKTKVFLNARTQYHLTVFHTSYPTDPRPDPLSLDSGLGVEDITQAPRPSERRPPAADELRRESKAMVRVVGEATPPTLELERVVMTATGTLLVTWVDRAGAVTELRSNLKRTFPGACTRQATILHTTLLRVVASPQLSAAQIKEINEVCDKYTRQHRGLTFTPTHMWWVHESEFSTITGEKERFTIGTARQDKA